MANDAPPMDYRALLEEEKRDLQSKLDELGLGGSGLTYDPNFADSSQVTAERGEVEALATKLRDALQEVLEALDKLEKGSYGTCEACGQPIDPIRLEAMPATRYCINCASKH